MNSSAPLITRGVRPEVHGHRGCRGLLPENTLPGFRHALKLGVDVLEMDVVISGDGQVVVSHEPWFSAAMCRQPNGAAILPEQEAAHNIFQLPYAEVRRYDCGLAHPRFPRQHPLPAYKPLLSEVLHEVEMLAARLVRAPIRYSIELKTDPATDHIFHPTPADFVPAVLAVMAQYQVQNRVTLLAFDARVLQVARVLAPTVPLCLLVEDERPLSAHLAELGFVPEVFGPDFHLLTPELIVEAQSYGMRTVPWTVNDIADMRRLLTAGVHGITTDYPDALLALLAELG